MNSPSSIDSLTPRELEILRFAASRLGDKEIAQQLNLSPRTVQNHLHRAYEKLGVSNRIQAARLLSDHYSGESIAMSPPPPLGAEKGVIEAPVGLLEDGKAPGGALYRRYVALNEWRRPRKMGGSVLWLILLWALAWLMIAVVGASLINPVLEMIHSLA
ncbi:MULTISPECIES: helix-turn-helix domain-containing protein [unclassified Brevundimonas]|uniref:helix-turn-helix domain-containing protein n=1 Tax=unclassified Brevundimonas TaxID=2622653 RepID=UPI0025C6265E|nr:MULTISPECIES: helix-turn-helix transcriptional regulator [unclassified Brevundimonas]